MQSFNSKIIYESWIIDWVNFVKCANSWIQNRHFAGNQNEMYFNVQNTFLSLKNNLPFSLSNHKNITAGRSYYQTPQDALLNTTVMSPSKC